jgi:hypothetical protein
MLVLRQNFVMEPPPCPSPSSTMSFEPGQRRCNVRGEVGLTRGASASDALRAGLEAGRLHGEVPLSQLSV